MGSRAIFTGGRFHRYSLDGQHVPSVTTITRKALGAPGLVVAAAKEAAYWGATHAGEVQQMGELEWVKAASTAHQRAWDRARDQGVQVHTLAEALVYGDPLPEADAEGNAWPDDVRRMAEQLARFFDAWDVQPLAHEALVFHELHRYAGRLDLVADLAGGERWLLDYKTSASGIWPETSLQLAAYRHCSHLVHQDQDVPMPEVQHAAAVWLRPDHWQLVPVRADLQVHGVFLHCQAVAAWADWRKDESVGAPMPAPDAA